MKFNLVSDNRFRTKKINTLEEKIVHPSLQTHITNCKQFFVTYHVRLVYQSLLSQQGKYMPLFSYNNANHTNLILVKQYALAYETL